MKISRLFQLVLICVACRVFPCTGWANGIPGLSDPDATPQTKALFVNLEALAGKHLLFGQQLATYKGKDGGKPWANIRAPFQDRSDCKDLVGSHPAVLGLNVERLFRKGEGVKSFMGVHVQKAYEAGEVVTFHAPLDNPVVRTGHFKIQRGNKKLDGSHNDLRGNPVRVILNESDGGKAREYLFQQLDTFAAFLKNFRDDQGQLIPIIFRPWHENTLRGCHWWDRQNASPEEFKALFRLTVDHLRKTDGLHNLLICFSPDKPDTGGRLSYLKWYPGDDYVDVLAFDIYGNEHEWAQWNQEGSKSEFLKRCRTVVTLAEAKHKIAAIGEFGLRDMPAASMTNFFTAQFLAPLKADRVARKVVYALTWANETSVFLPTDWMHDKIPDFKAFYHDPYVLFANDLKSRNSLYSMPQ